MSWLRRLGQPVGARSMTAVIVVVAVLLALFGFALFVGLCAGKFVCS